MVSGFIRDSSGNVSVSTTLYSLDATTADGMTVVFGGDGTGMIDYNSGILAVHLELSTLLSTGTTMAQVALRLSRSRVSLSTSSILPA